MKDHIKNYMKIGLVHFMAFPQVMKGEGEITEALLPVLKDDYFDAIEVTWIKDQAEKEKAISCLKQSHITVAYGASPRLLTTGLNINDRNEAGRQLAVATLKEGIDEAYQFGAAGFGFLSGQYEEDYKEEAFNALVKSTEELCAYAKSKGDMPLILELFDFDFDKKCLIGPAPLANKFAEVICQKHDNFGLMIDLSHIPQTREDIREAVFAIKDHLWHVHIGNVVMKDPSMPAYGDVHPRFGFPNSENGVAEVTEFLRALFEVGYLQEGKRPIVSFEVKPVGEEDPLLVIANAKRVLNEAWSKLNL